jgi:hypothetical protein
VRESPGVIDLVLLVVLSGKIVRPGAECLPVVEASEIYQRISICRLRHRSLAVMPIPVAQPWGRRTSIKHLDHPNCLDRSRLERVQGKSFTSGRRPSTLIDRLLVIRCPCSIGSAQVRLRMLQCRMVADGRWRRTV